MLTCMHSACMISFIKIYHQAKKFSKAYNLSTCCVYGGGSKYEQSLALKERCEILVATPVSMCIHHTMELPTKRLGPKLFDYSEVFIEGRLFYID